MKKILLILSFLRLAEKTIGEAIALAKKMNAELVVFFVLDEEYANKIANRLTDDGWIGMKPSEQLYHSILQEYRSQAEMKIAEVEQTAQKNDVPVRSFIVSGPVLEETSKIAQTEKPDLIVITRRKRSNLSRFIFGSLAESLEQQVDCEVRIIDAE